MARHQINFCRNWREGESKRWVLLVSVLPLQKKRTGSDCVFPCQQQVFHICEVCALQSQWQSSDRSFLPLNTLSGCQGSRLFNTCYPHTFLTLSQNSISKCLQIKFASNNHPTPTPPPNGPWSLKSFVISWGHTKVTNQDLVAIFCSFWMAL